MMRIRPLLCLSLLVAGAHAAAAATYEMADLKALEKQGSWQELVEHLEDIPPSKRNAEWQGIAERGCTSYLGTFEIKEDRDAALPLEEMGRLLKRYAFLKQSRPFMAKRAEVGLKSFQYSYSLSRHNRGDDKWLTGLEEFVQADTVTTDLPLRAAKLVVSRLVADTAFPFFKMALARSGKAVCKEPEFHQTLVATLDEGVWLPEVTEIVQKTCWNEVKGPLLAALGKSESDSYREHVCPALQAKNALNAELKAKCEAK
ncbi:MAG TPA: hypothetical protein VH877_21815 [Polyangia bacterium]|jgi:hypothetical protein|nr:hypothetical protein [Polyangia bacterium]